MVRADLDALFQFVVKRKPIVISDDFLVGQQDRAFETPEHLFWLAAQAVKLKMQFNVLSTLRKTHTACFFISYVFEYRRL